MPKHTRSGSAGNKENNAGPSAPKKRILTDNGAEAVITEDVTGEVTEEVMEGVVEDHDKELEKIMGVAMDQDELKFLIKFKNQKNLKIVPAKIVNLKYPMQVIQFYESRVEWQDKTSS